MQDVADAAGVHRTTVSLAIRHHPSIPPATRRRILTLADRMGYRPNPLVSALMTELRGKRSKKQHEVIAYVTTYPEDNPWRRYPSLRDMFAGAQAKAAALGFAVQEFDLGAAEMDGVRLARILRTRGIRGILLAPPPEPWKSFPLDLSSFAAVLLGIGMQSMPLEHVASDHYQCMRIAVGECLRLGYERIGFVVGREISKRLEGRWLAAYLYEQALLGGPALRPLLVQDSARWWKDPAIETWVRREKPDAILSPLSDKSWRDLAALPGNPGVANLTLPPGGQGCAGILQDTFKLGEIGVERVVSRLLHNDIGPLSRAQNTMLHGAWVDGESLPAKAPQKKATGRRKQSR